MDALLTALEQNRRRLAVRPTDRQVQEDIARELQRSMDSLRPLKARIAATDRLIDQIVYKLYGLTDEEIAIVEGETTAATH